MCVIRNTLTINAAILFIHGVIKHSAHQPKKNSSEPTSSSPTSSKPTPKVTYMKGEKDILSMFYPEELWFNGYHYWTPEHAYQHQKCLLFDYYDRASSILENPLPRAAKAAGKITGDLMSRDMKVKLMKDVLFHGWCQQPTFQEALKRTEGCTMVHNVNDGFWGQYSSGDGINAYGICLEQTLNCNK